MELPLKYLVVSADRLLVPAMTNAYETLSYL